MCDWLRPHAVILDGQLERGIDVAVVDGIVEDIRPQTEPADPYILSPAFVNAHSHLEYRGMLDQISHPEYYEWLYELARLKPLETPEFVREQCDLAARENRATGVAWIGEHSDRPGSAEAMIHHRLGGWIFHEVITAGAPYIEARMNDIQVRMNKTQAKLQSTPNGLQTALNPHAYFTVARDILRQLGANGQPSSIHVAETIHESNFTRTGTGPIADRRRSFGIPFDIYGQSVVEVLDDLGVLRPGMQCVHCCDVDANDIAIMASRGVTIAHCPRSNTRLQCPTAPVREFLDAGITVGLGMDSPASGGPINMFAEMREALRVSRERNAALSPEEVWQMATNAGYQSFGKPEIDWGISKGSKTPLIAIQIQTSSMSDLISQANPEMVKWIA